MPASEPHALRGATDRGSLGDFRDVFEEMEPLADAELDDPVNPRELRIRLQDGVGTADAARIDVEWTTVGDHKAHYTDSAGRDYRFGEHPHDYPRPDDEKHFHPPPDASADHDEVEDACIEHRELELVARAIHKLWRKAYEQGSFAQVNDASDPP